MSYFRKIKLAILFVLIFSFLSGGCSKDENPIEAKSDPRLAGIWEITKMTYEYQGVTETLTESQLDSMDFVWTFTIEDDGTIEQTTNISGPLLTMPGTGSSSANQLTLNLTGPTGKTGTIIYEYAVDGNILKLNWEIPAGTKFAAEFTKQ